MLRRASLPGFLRRPLQAGLLCVAMVVMMGAGQSRFERLGHEMMCVCSCGQILVECNHVGCPDSDRMIHELREQLASGAGDTAILNWFTAKYGATVLAAPIRGGFDVVAWVVPIVVFVLAVGGTAAIVLMWRRRAPVHVAAGAPGVLPEIDSAAAAMRERIRRETEY